MNIFDDIMGTSLQKPSTDYFGDTAKDLDSIISGGGLQSASVINQVKNEISSMLKWIKFFKQKIAKLTKENDERAR